MANFIEDIIDQLDLDSLNNQKFILPSKRAGLFFRNALKNKINKTIFSPQIISIEEFIEELSGLVTCNNTELLFIFYKVYLANTQTESTEGFESFSKWAQIIIQDFNEIDRYLIPSKEVLDYISNVKEIEHWSLETEKTPLVESYIAFWNQLSNYYDLLHTELNSKNVGYQGMVYKKASELTGSYIKENSNTQHHFIGFNALNTAEINIFKTITENSDSKIHWDLDKEFYNKNHHAAGFFLRKHYEKWVKNNTDFSWLGDNYTQKKNITIIAAQKNIGQVKAVSNIINELTSEEVQKTALVLGDENLLTPVLNAIPVKNNNVAESVNITMGIPLNLSPINSVFEKLFELNKNNDNIYYKDVVALLSNDYIQRLFDSKTIEDAINKIQTNNAVYLSYNEIKELLKSETTLANLIFTPWKNNPKTAITKSLEFIDALKATYTKDNTSKLDIEYLSNYYNVFETLQQLNNDYNYLSSTSALHQVFKEILSFETLDLKGKATEGLQIMGMLETRVLDYETVILTSVNEGTLPAGKSNNSFIPYEIKEKKGLPTYKEKDAVYTYHFYRLLQRARNIYIIYNTVQDSLQKGEKSRFIEQLEFEGIHNITYKTATSHIPFYTKSLKEIKKDDSVMERLKEIGTKGFSPSSLTNYVRNPLDFYKERILKIRDENEVEETIAANTLGTVVHDTLEILYTPFIDKEFTVEGLKSLKGKIEETVIKCFQKTYKEGNIKEGQNLIIYEVAKRFVLNMINFEIKDIEAGNTIKILELEADNKIKINLEGIDFPITITGKVDRIDLYNNELRIIDYKSGKVDQTQVQVKEWDDIITDYKKYSKTFQVLTYAFMKHKMEPLNFPLKGGIISFKNLKAGFIAFRKEIGSRKYDYNITQDTLNEYENQLKRLLKEIYDKEIPFTEKEIETLNF